MLIQQIRISDDRIHRCPHIVTHIEQEAGLSFIGLLFLSGSHSKLLRIDNFPMSAPCALPVTHGEQCGQYKCKNNTEELLRSGNPAIFRDDLKIPGIIGNFADYFQRIVQHRIITLGNCHLFSCRHTASPDLIMVRSILKALKFHILNEVLPVQYHYRKSPERLLSLFVCGIDRIKQKDTHSSLSEFKWTCNGVLPALHSQICFFFSGRIRKKIQAHCFFISRKRIDLCDDSVLCKFDGFNNMCIILHHLSQHLKLFIIQFMSVLHQIFQHICLGQILTELGFHTAYGCLCHIGGF